PVTNLARKFNLNILARPEDFGGAYPTTPVSTRVSFIKQRRETVTKFMRAMVEGIHVYKTQKEFSKKVYAKYIKVTDPDVLEDSYQFFAPLVPAKPYPPLDGIKEALLELSEGDPKARAAQPQEFADMSLVKELDESGFIDALYKVKKCLRYLTPWRRRYADAALYCVFEGRPREDRFVLQPLSRHERDRPVGGRRRFDHGRIL